MSRDIPSVEERVMNMVGVVLSSLPERDKQLKMLRLFKEKVREWKSRSWKKIEEMEAKKKRKEGIESSGDENVVIGGVIVEGGVSKKAKKKKNKKKRKAKGTEEEQDGFDPSW